MSPECQAPDGSRDGAHFGCTVAGVHTNGAHGYRFKAVSPALHSQRSTCISIGTISASAMQHVDPGFLAAAARFERDKQARAHCR